MVPETRKSDEIRPSVAGGVYFEDGGRKTRCRKRDVRYILRRRGGERERERETRGVEKDDGRDGERVTMIQRETVEKREIEGREEKIGRQSEGSRIWEESDH